MVRDYLHSLDQAKDKGDAFAFELSEKEEKIREHFKALGNVTKMYDGQLLLFLKLYRFTLTVTPTPGLQAKTIVWDSDLSRLSGQYREMNYAIDDRAVLNIQYQLHAYNKRQQAEQLSGGRLRWIGVLALAGTGLAGLWIFLVQHRERERERQRALVQQQINQAENLRLEEELRRREAEQRQQDAEHKLLEQRLATQAAERQALELRSQLYASIGIMAGSYAHNINNLLVQPNDLLSGL